MNTKTNSQSNVAVKPNTLARVVAGVLLSLQKPSRSRRPGAHTQPAA